MIRIVEQIRQSALASNRGSATRQEVAAQRAELSALNATAGTTILATSRVLTVAGELEHWDKGADDPRNPGAKSLFQLPTQNSKLHFIDLSDPHVALQLALNRANEP